MGHLSIHVFICLVDMNFMHTHTVHIRTHTHLLTHCSTAPHRRPDINYQPAISTMHTNPNFSRGTPGRSTYAYGSRRPPPAVIHHFEATPTGEASSQPSPGPVGGGFFKRLIPSRFSRRYANVICVCEQPLFRTRTTVCVPSCCVVTKDSIFSHVKLCL